MTTADRICTLLNEAFASDPGAVHALVCNRVPCNAALAGHPTIVVDEAPIEGTPTTVGLLGIINGLFAPGEPVIAASWEDGPPRRMTGFVAVPDRRRHSMSEAVADGE